MATGTSTIVSHNMDLSDRAQVGSLERLLARKGVTLSEVREGVESASDAELMPFGLRAYRLNLLSLFGKAWSQQAIFATARRAAISKILGGWEHHHHYLPNLGITADAQRLHDVPTDRINALLAQGRGLIVMSFHLGHMRQIATDLAHAGISVCGPLAADAFNNYRTARIANPDAALWTHLRLVNVEERRGTFALVRSLAGGGCIFSTIDGNTGLDGPHGNQRRMTVSLLEATARVKTGLFDMAARFGAPILVMAAYTEGEKRVCKTAPVIDPERSLAGEEAKYFVETATRAAYAFFGVALTDHADEWCGGDLFHQWKLSHRTPPHDLAVVERDLNERLAAGEKLIVDHRRILPLDRDGDLVWSDAVSGRCFRLPQHLAIAAHQLSADGAGIDTHWLGQHAEPTRSQMLSLLCQLASRDVIKVSEKVHARSPL